MTLDDLRSTLDDVVRLAEEARSGLATVEEELTAREEQAADALGEAESALKDAEGYITQQGQVLLAAVEALHDEAHEDNRVVFRLCQRPTCRDLRRMLLGE